MDELTQARKVWESSVKQCEVARANYRRSRENWHAGVGTDTPDRDVAHAVYENLYGMFKVDAIVYATSCDIEVEAREHLYNLEMAAHFQETHVCDPNPMECAVCHGDGSGRV